MKWIENPPDFDPCIGITIVRPFQKLLSDIDLSQYSKSNFLASGVSTTTLLNAAIRILEEIFKNCQRSVKTRFFYCWFSDGPQVPKCYWCWFILRFDLCFFRRKYRRNFFHQGLIRKLSASRNVFSWNSIFSFLCIGIVIVGKRSKILFSFYLDIQTHISLWPRTRFFSSTSRSISFLESINSDSSWFSGFISISVQRLQICIQFWRLSAISTHSAP